MTVSNGMLEIQATIDTIKSRAEKAVEIMEALIAHERMPNDGELIATLESIDRLTSSAFRQIHAESELDPTREFTKETTVEGEGNSPAAK